MSSSQCGFFDRARPPADDNVSDQEQLTADQTGDAWGDSSCWEGLRFGRDVHLLKDFNTRSVICMSWTLRLVDGLRSSKESDWQCRLETATSHRVGPKNEVHSRLSGTKTFITGSVTHMSTVYPSWWHTRTEDKMGLLDCCGDDAFNVSVNEALSVPV